AIFSSNLITSFLFTAIINHLFQYFIKPASTRKKTDSHLRLYSLYTTYNSTAQSFESALSHQSALINSSIPVDHRALISSDKKGVCSIINNATNESLIHDWISANGVSANIYNTINNIKYTSTKPKIAPSILLNECKIGNSATKSSMEAII